MSVIHLLLAVWLPWLLLFNPGRSGYPPAPHIVTLQVPEAAARGRLAGSGYDIIDVDPILGTVDVLLPWGEALGADTFSYPLVGIRRMDGFPPEDAAYHNFAEMETDLHDLVTAHPAIARLNVFGRSIENRNLYALRISAAPPDEGAALPGVLYVGNIHAREHLTLEQALWLAHYYCEQYGRNPAVTNLVNRREIWILPNVNPDGTAYDLAGRNYHWWRKNRRRNADGSYGVDLNRNFGYRWGGIGAAITPNSETYRGTAPFSELETTALRVFVQEHENLRTSIFMHTYSELVLWPYGYTTQALPSDMQPDDLHIFQTAGKAMARLNGYTPMQSSSLYPTSGSSDDWLYGARHIYAWTFELYPTVSPPGFYPPGSVIKQQVERNRGALTYAASIAAAPRTVLGEGDTQAPVITMTLPLTTTWAGVPLTVTTIASDQSGVTLLSLLLDGDPVTMTQKSVLTFTFSLPAGEHSLQAVAFDDNQNCGRGTPRRLFGREYVQMPWHNFLPVAAKTKA